MQTPVGAVFLARRPTFDRNSFVRRNVPFQRKPGAPVWLIGAGIALAGAIWAQRGRVAEQPHSHPTSDVVEELALLIDGAVDYAIYMLDPDGLVTIWNKGAERLKGWTEAEVVGQSIAMFYPVDSVAADKPALDLIRARALGRFDEDDWRLRKDGSEFLAHVSMTALYDRAGALRGFGKVLRDVTEQRATESALRANASHLSSILSTVPDAMIVIDEAGSILSFSAAAERLFGFRATEIIGSNVSRLMPAPDRQRHDGYLQNYLTTGVRQIIGIGRVVIGARHDGSTFPMALSVAEAAGADGQKLFTGFIRDLTERQRTQLRVEELQSELIHVARVSAMGTMASTLAHELNQPITAVVNYLESIRDLLDRPRAEDLPAIRGALGDAVGQALRAGDIVHRLRNFVTRGDAEKTIEHLPSLIGEAAALGLLGTREIGIDARFDLDPDASPVLVDKVQIQQVLVNLIRNAVEVMAGSPLRQLSIVARVESAECIRISVADTGMGVADAMVDQLFTAFASSKDEGMGLGLSICRTIVEANGGRIWLEQPASGGTAFHFTLVKPGTEVGYDG